MSKLYDNEIWIFTDGATPANHSQNKDRKGGVGVFFGEDDERNISFGLVETDKFKVTNNVCELTACIKAIEKLLSTTIIINKQIIIYTDSMYIVNTISSWAKEWASAGWKKSGGKIQNLELIKKLYYYSLNLGIIFRHVDAHTIEPEDKTSKEWRLWNGNNNADKLAVFGAKKVK